MWGSHSGNESGDRASVSVARPTDRERQPSKKTHSLPYAACSRDAGRLFFRSGDLMAPAAWARFP
jgi:hypothetical protein